MRDHDAPDAVSGFGDYRNVVRLVLLLSLLLHLNLLLSHRLLAPGKPFLETDSIEYLALADHLAAGQPYAQDGRPEIYRAPGYPAFVAGFRFWFPERLLPVILAQVGLNLLLLILTWNLALALFQDRRLAFAAMLLQALSGVSLIYAMKILSETLFAFMLMLTFVLLEWAVPQRKEHPWRCALLLLGAGLGTGAACLIRVIAMPLVPLLVLYILWRIRRWHLVLAFVVPVVLVLGLWTWRNHAVAGYRGLATVGDFNLYRYNAAAVTAKQKGISLEQEKDLIDRELAAIPDEAERASVAKQRAMAIIKAAPFTYLALHLKGDLVSFMPASGNFLRLFGVEVIGQGKQSEFLSEGLWAGMWSSFSRHWAILLVMLPGFLFLLVKYGVCVVGIFSALVRSGQPDWRILFYVVVLAWFLGIPGPGSYSRFRVPAEPLLALFAAAGLWRVIPWFRQKAGVTVPCK